MLNLSIPTRPNMPTVQDENRAQESAIRRRMLEGTWKKDLLNVMSEHLNPGRMDSWGPPDLSTNLLETITRELSKLYHETPTVSHNEADITALTGRDGLLQPLWPLMQRAQQSILALREGFIRCDYIPAGEIDKQASIQYRLVTPDYVYCESNPSAPDIPTLYQEYRIRVYQKKGVDGATKPDPEIIWTVDIFDLRNMKKPSFKICRVDDSGKIGEDLTKYYLGVASLKGEKYPYRYSDGFPFMPIVMYHAEATGKLWNSYDKKSLTAGAMQTAMLGSYWLHICKSASYEQRYIAGLTLQGLNQLEADQPARRAELATDPSSILVFQQDPDAMQGQPLIGSFSPSVDPNSFLQAIHSYEKKIASSFSISASLLRESGDPRSGYSIAISKDGQRQAQRIQAPIFRVYDSKLCNIVAAMANRFMGLNLPEDNKYRVAYAPIPLSGQESKEQRESILSLTQAGLMSPIQAYQILNPDTDEQQAEIALEKIRRERSKYQLI